jgi:hypothetical protein
VRPLLVLLLMGMAVVGWGADMGRAVTAGCVVLLADENDRPEVERLLTAGLRLPSARRIGFFSEALLGRAYRPETKARIGEQRKPPPTKREATNAEPIPVKVLKTSFTYLDCMTYVEHVLALAASDRAEYRAGFLPRLVDVMFDADGTPLMSHHRNHFTSHWGEVLERKGYLINVARGHPGAVTRHVLLNRVGTNRTFYVEDRFMIATEPQAVRFFPLEAVLAGQVPLQSGDVVAMATDKDGLDVTHMGFFIERHEGRFLRHASLTRNRVVDEEFEGYLKARKGLTGLMVFRPVLRAPEPPAWYRFEVAPPASKTPGKTKAKKAPGRSAAGQIDRTSKVLEPRENTRSRRGKSDGPRL